jgi:protein-tyrosine phosphatase
MTDVIRFHESKMTEIWERLYLGCLYDATELRTDNPKEITAVLNCTPDAVDYSGTKIIQHRIPLWHDGFAINKADFWPAMEFIRTRLWHGDRVLVHCHAGMSRSPGMIAGFLHLMGFKEFEQAIDYVKLLRPIIQPNIEVLNSIKRHMKVWPYSDGAFNV